jgi:hypothetical protein
MTWRQAMDYAKKQKDKNNFPKPGAPKKVGSGYDEFDRVGKNNSVVGSRLRAAFQTG